MIPPRNPRASDRPGAEPEPTPSVEPRLARLAALIEEFRIEAERYFNGALAIPPEDKRVKVQHALRDLRSMSIRSAADQFRMSGLEARFNLLSASYGRRLRERVQREDEHDDAGQQFKPARRTAAIRGCEGA